MVLRVDDFGGPAGGTAEVTVSVDGKPLGTRVVTGGPGHHRQSARQP